MKLSKNLLFWSIIAMIFGLLLFAYGCFGAGDRMQYAGAFFIAIGLLSSDYAITEKKRKTVMKGEEVDSHK